MQEPRRPLRPPGQRPSESSDRPPPLTFPRRVRALPPVKELADAYGNVRDSPSLLGCLVQAWEWAGLLAAAPALTLTRHLRSACPTPVHVADLLLCKGLNVAERVLPCLMVTPSQVCRALAFGMCGAPARACYLSSKFACRSLRTCLCDFPALTCTVSTRICCSTTEMCLCDAPAALCDLPAEIALGAAGTALGDADTIIRAIESCSDIIACRLRPNHLLDG